MTQIQIPRPVIEPAPDRDQLLAVVQWARANGWYPTWFGWTSPDRSTAVEVDTDVTHGADIKIRRRDPVTGGRPMYPDSYRVDSVAQGVDLLVVLGVLPVELSTAYAAGMRAAQTAVNAPMWRQAA